MRTAAIAIVLVSASLLPGSARGQAPTDHLKCFKVKDPQAKTLYTADPTGLLDQTGCTFKSAAALACVPSSLENVSPVPASEGGLGAPNPFVCYKLKCPKGVVPPLAVQDAYGSRILEKGAAKMICAPAASTITPPTCVGPREPTVQKLLTAVDATYDDAGNLDWPSNCGGSTPVCCTGGTPVSPCGPVKTTVYGVSFVDVPGASRLDLTLHMALQTLSGLPVTIPLVGECLIHINTSAGATPTVRVDVPLYLSVPDGDLYVASVGGLAVSNFTTDDVSISGSFGCLIADLGLGFFVGTIQDVLFSEFQNQFVGLCVGQEQ